MAPREEPQKNERHTREDGRCKTKCAVDHALGEGDTCDGIDAPEVLFFGVFELETMAAEGDPGRSYIRTPRCENYGKPDTGEQHLQPCTEPARCANCYGPAPANHDGCPAKPTRKNGKLVLPSRTIRKAGQKLYNNAHTQEDRTTRDY